MQRHFTKNREKKLENITFNTAEFNGAPCAFFDGMYDYFNLNAEAWKAKNPGAAWNGPCASIKYTADPAGSLNSYRHLLGLMMT